MACFSTGTFPFNLCAQSKSVPQPTDTKVYESESIRVNAPQHVLGSGSLQLTTTEKKVSFQHWTEEENAESFSILQAISSLWHKNKTADQYLVYAKNNSLPTHKFTWEIIPYQRTSGLIGRFWQQLKVLWRITFGATNESPALHQKKVSVLSTNFHEEMKSLESQASKVEEVAQGSDAFCKEDVITKQRVLEGKSINVLYNYAPIGIGNERLHFLIVPKTHRKSFKELTKEEYLEASQLTQLLLKHFQKTRPVRGAYIFHKTGPDAGQTVDHWHMHLIITTSPTEDFMGKVKVLWKMIFGSSPLRGEALSKPVEKYKKELSEIEQG